MKTNYHTHTTFCDGRNSVEEMALSAIERRFDILGFSSHSLYPHSSDWHIDADKFGDYFNTIRAVAKKYADKIKIYAGLETEYIPIFSADFKWQYRNFSPAPDYLIGSVHYVLGKNGLFSIDDKAEKVREGIDHFFGGDGKKAVCEYFALQREMLATQDFLILGHADVVRRRNTELRFFDEADLWYKKEIKATAAAASKTNVIVEINTGGITRSLLNDVYPSAEFLSLFHERGVPITISSDAHTADGIDASFDRAIAAAQKAGYTEYAYFDDGEIKFEKLSALLFRL